MQKFVVVFDSYAHAQYSMYTDAHIKVISEILGQTTTGSEIAVYITAHPISGYTYMPGTKWRVFREYFTAINRGDPHTSGIEDCIEHFMSPSLFIGREATYTGYRTELNKVLGFIGKELNERGKFQNIEKVTTLSEAEARASSLLKKVDDRKMHPAIKQVCRAELLRNDFYDIVFEASKGVFEHVRVISGYKELDGDKLLQNACSSQMPSFVINNHTTESEISEYKGFVNLLRGIHGNFRNPVAHTLKQNWGKTEIEVLEILGIISHVHRRLDEAKRTCYAKN